MRDLERWEMLETLSQLDEVLALNERRHLGKAAEACFVTQPTSSTRVQKLEDEVGIVIFERSRRPILPTSEGALVGRGRLGPGISFDRYTISFDR